jgi:hypothetical protein
MKNDRINEMSNEIASLLDINQTNQNKYNNDFEILKKTYEEKFDNSMDEIEKLSKYLPSISCLLY